MMRQAKRLEALKTVTELRLQADQARMTEVSVNEADLRRKLEDLALRRQDRSWPALAGGDASAVARADLYWQLWIDQRRSAINAELASVLAQKAERKAVLRESLGRDQAAQKMYTSALTAAKSLASRRAHYES